MSFSSEAKLLLQNIKSVNEISFDELALNIFKFQFSYCTVYQEYCLVIGKNPSNVNSIYDVPFLPIEFFKTHNVTSFDFSNIDLIFMSSGTEGERSKHYIYDNDLYKSSILDCFEEIFGSPSKYIFYCLTPDAATNPNSSLGYMCKVLCNESNNEESRIYPNLNNLEEVTNSLLDHNHKFIPFVIGVSFALWDFADYINFPLPQNTILIETGGMKGRKKEPIKEEFHQILKNKFSLFTISSEYGMAELMSQSYAIDGINFNESKFQKILIRDVTDPFSYLKNNSQGGINIIDLNNLYTCSFIETKDIGVKIEDNIFQILGRFDNSEQRGCSLIYA